MTPKIENPEGFSLFVIPVLNGNLHSPVYKKGDARSEAGMTRSSELGKVVETFSDRLCFGRCGCRSFFLLFVLAAEGKHLVASRIEALPDLFGVFTRNGTDFLPQAAEMLDLVHRGDDRLIVQVGEQVFGLFAE